MKKNILIVDDSSADLAEMKKTLEKKSYKVVVANDGAEALDSLMNNGFDLILIDIMMPALSGYDLLRLLRERLNHHVKMVYISIIPKKEVDTTDIDGFIQKPFNPKSLLAGINKALRD